MIIPRKAFPLFTGLTSSMAAVDSFHLLYREVARSCHNHLELLAVVGALYTAKKSLNFLYDCYSLLRLHVTPCLFSKRNLVHQYGQWAVVIGIMDNIVKAYAEELAKCGMNILLISSNREMMRTFSEAISGTYGVKSNFLDINFSDGPDVYFIVKIALTELDVGILVNNTAVFDEYSESIVEAPEEKVWEIINVTIAASVMMAHAVLPVMVKKKRGAIINMIPGSVREIDAQIAAAKAYLMTFSRQLYSEVISNGIFVQCLTPLHIRSIQTSRYGISSIFSPAPDVYARHAVRTLGYSSRTTGYWPHSLQLLACRWIPSWLCRSIGSFAQQ